MKFREPVNAVTHLIGIVLSVLALTTIVFTGIIRQNGVALIGGSVFALSMIALYTASTVYHSYSGNHKVILKLRKIDHAMIFVLIAGTYTPICLTVLSGPLGFGLLIGVWLLAAIGIITKIWFINMPRVLSAAMYLFLGWISVLFISPLFKALPLNGFIWLVLGGIMYTVGSIFYASKSERIQIGKFGFHEIFHLFIMAGSLAHFILIQQYVIAIS